MFKVEALVYMVGHSRIIDVAQFATFNAGEFLIVMLLCHDFTVPETVSARQERSPSPTRP